MTSLRRDELFHRGLPQPKPESHRLALYVIRESAKRLELSLLNDVRRINADAEARRHAEINGLPEIIAMQREELFKRFAIPVSDPLKQDLRLRGILNVAGHFCLCSLAPLYGW